MLFYNFTFLFSVYGRTRFLEKHCNQKKNKFENRERVEMVMYGGKRFYHYNEDDLFYLSFDC